jgi:hypothetical protein
VSCKLDHSDPDCFPEFLCRTCHPLTGQAPVSQDPVDVLDRELAHAQAELQSLPKGKKYAHRKALLEDQVSKLCGQIADAM